MRIRRLELHGFKSFADRTVFHFGDGISCVVGPNGCGKSNVVDALKWVIGEQSAKSLRGGEMQDVIFAGSAGRKPVGYAEVGLTFSSEGTDPFPGEYARYTEIQVARRLYRSGTSEYLINQTRCRRRDIVDLLMDSGVGNNLYSFIEQGRIDKIVSASPGERRSLIDEAAGITRYKQRRAEAQSKLEATGGQLDRAADVAEEMGRRLRTLERQVLKAARFRRLRALVRQEEIFLGLVKYAALTTQRTEVGARLGSLRQRAEALDERVDQLESDLEVRRGEAEVSEAAVGVARDALAEFDARRREVQATMGLHERRCGEIRDELAGQQELLTREQEAVTDATAELEASELRLEELVAELELVQASSEDAEIVLAECDELRVSASANVRALEDTLATRNEARAETTVRVSQLRTAVTNLPGRIDELKRRLHEASNEAVVLAKRVIVAEEACTSCEEDEVALRVSIDESEAALDQQTRRHVHAMDAVRSAQTELDASQRLLDDAIAKVETTAGMAEEEVAGEVARAQRSEDRKMVEADRADAAEVTAIEDAARAQLASRERGARLWIEWRQKYLDQTRQTWRTRAEQELGELDSQRQARVDAAVDEVASAVMAIEDRVQAETEAALEASRDQQAEYERRLEAARHSQANAEARLAVVVRERREMEGRLAALEAADAASRERDAGASAVADSLDNPPRLADVLEVPDDAREWVGRVMGGRLAMPVLTSDGHVTQAARAARDAGATEVLFLTEPPTLDALMARVEVADTLDDAVALHRRTGRAVVVPPTGDRIESDGVVRLRSQLQQEDDLLGRQAEMSSLREAIDKAVAQEVALDGEITDARAKVEGAKIGLRASSERTDRLEKEGRVKLREQVDACRLEGESRVRALREDYASWRREARQELERGVAEHVGRRDRELESLRQELAQQVVQWRQDADADLVMRRAECEDRREARRQNSLQAIEAVREAAWTRVRATTEDVQVRREEARMEVAGHREVLDAARARAEKAAAKLDEVRRAVEGHQRQLSEKRVLHARLQAEARSAREQQVALEQRRESQRREVDDLARELTSAREDLSRADLVHGAAQAAAEEATEALQAARLAADEADQRAREARDARDHLSRNAAALAAERGGLAATKEAAERRTREGRARVTQANDRIEELVTRQEEAQALLIEANEKLDALSADGQEAATKFEAARKKYEDTRAALGQVERSLREEELALGEVQRELTGLEQTDHQAGMELESLEARLDERYQVDIAHYLAHLEERSGLRLDVSEEARQGLQVAGKKVEPVEDLIIRPAMLDDEDMVREYVERIADHRQKLARIGDVNLTALEEYTELHGRHQELEGQRDDLDESVQTIRAAIAKMNKTCRERFRETFDQVDQAFREAYPNLVGGGEARLSLTDEEDLLETGVEIFVRPPGKRLQNLGLLSGGEKAMTAIALLLALFTVKPSPFCVLDEVDAPLDEANGARFNDMLRHMATMTQFIVITHNRKTMECADTLYGITMPTPGCSALVSVEVDG